MDERQLKDMLSGIRAPAASETAPPRAIEAALAAFDKNFANSNQEIEEEDRPTDTGSTGSIRRFLMQKRSVLTGVGGAVALCALATVLGAPFFSQQVMQISGGLKNSDSFSVVGAETKITAGAEISDTSYMKKVQEKNLERAQQAAQEGASALPTPIGASENQTLALPQAPQAPAANPLAEWHAKSEAKRIAPAEAQKQNFKDISRNVMTDSIATRKRPEAESVLTKEIDEKGYAGGRADKIAPQNKPVASAEAVAGLAATPSSRIAMPTPVPQPEPVVVAPPPPSDYGSSYYQDQGRDAFPDFQDNPVRQAAAEPVSTFSIDVDTSSYSFLRRMINQGTLPPKGAVRLEELINYFPYDYALPGRDEDPFRPTVAVYKAPWNAEHKLVHIGIKGYDLTEKPKSNLVFLIDTSGSMNSPDKLPLVISSLKLMLDDMNADDTIGIVTYAGSAGVALEPTKVAEKAKIIEALDRLRSGGSTAGAEGIRSAYNLAEQGFVKEGNNRIILATDGDFNVGISDPAQLKDFIANKRGEGIFLSVLGFGQGNYQDTTMQALAQNGNGNAAYIDSLSEARKVLVEEAGSTLFTIAKDVKIQVEFNPALVQEYRLIGYETRHLNREDFNNDKIDAGEIGAGHAVTAIYEITPVGATPVVDGLRYGSKEMALVKQDDSDKAAFSSEIAFLKMRYKRPDENVSKLMTRPITAADEKDFAALPDDIRFAAAVAGFGQLLRESQYTGSLTWDQVIEMAASARGKDEFGYRMEFVNLARLAKSVAKR